MFSKMKIGQTQKIIAIAPQEMVDFFTKYLEKEKTKGMKPESTFMGSLLYNLGDAFKKETGLSYSDYHNKYFKEEPAAYKKAFEKVFGKDGWQAMKESNKKKR